VTYIAPKYLGQIEVSGYVLNARHSKEHIERVEYVTVGYRLIRLFLPIQMIDVGPPAELWKPATVQTSQRVVHKGRIIPNHTFLHAHQVSA
jgi:hypothetical protein